MDVDLYQLSDEVETEEDFINFLTLLAQNKEEEDEIEKETPSSPWGPGAKGWENGNIASFLGAASAWAASSKNGMPLYTKPTNIWKRAAQIIHASKFYE